GWIVKAVMKQYHQTLDPNSPGVAYLDLTPTGHGLYLNAGILRHRRAGAFAPVEQSPDRIVLQAPLEGGGAWTRELRLTKKASGYLLQMTDRVRGIASPSVYYQIVERNPDKKKDTFYEHVGPVAFLNGKLRQVDYEELDERRAITETTKGGWIGVMNRYFLASFILDPSKQVEVFFKTDGASYQAGFFAQPKASADGARIYQTAVYLGPKSTPILESLGVELERSVDFGWFAFIAIPLHKFLLWVHRFVPNYGLDIIILVVLIKILFFYPTHRSYLSMAAMRKIQPEIERLRELYGDDRQRMAEELMKLYRKHKVNPVSGCLPIFIQIPVFFALYKVLLVSIEMRHAPFVGWIKDLSAPDPYFVLPVLMGLSMYIQQRLNPQPSDPMQARLMQFMPVAFTLMFLFFPSGLVLYWFTNNLLSILQQWLVYKRMHVA
ncbi:MAG: membrane protein insertase YidC, partial [Zetaproteobacteria bacterium]